MLTFVNIIYIKAIFNSKNTLFKYRINTEKFNMIGETARVQSQEYQFLQATRPERKYGEASQSAKEYKTASKTPESYPQKKYSIDDYNLAYAVANGDYKVTSGKNIFIPQTSPIQPFGTEKSPSGDKKALLNTHIDSFQETLDREYSINNTLKYVNANDGEVHPIYGEDEHELCFVS